jgi:hypothetical protein
VRLDVVEGAGSGESSLFSGVLLSSLVGLLAGGATRGMAPAEGVPLALLFVGLFALLDAVGDAATTFLDPRDVPLLRTLAIAPAAAPARAARGAAAAARDQGAGAGASARAGGRGARRGASRRSRWCRWWYCSRSGSRRRRSRC